MSADSDGDEDQLINNVATDGWSKRVKRRVADEMTLLLTCAKSASPDRSAASVIFLVLFAFSVTCMLSRYMMSSETGRFPYYVVPMLIIALEVIAAIFLLLMLSFARKRDCDDCILDADLQPWHRLLRKNVKLFGIIPFYFGVFVFDVFRLIANGWCISEWMLCTNDLVRIERLVDLLYPIARAGYLFVELIVCIKFNAADIFHNTLVLIALAFVQATNLSGWLDALVSESDVLSSQQNWTLDLSRCFNETDVNRTLIVSDHFIQCLSGTTGEYQLLDSVSPYLYPFIVEYLMLVIECVADWFFSDAARHRDGVVAMSHLDRARSTTSTPNNESGTALAEVTSFADQEDGHPPCDAAADIQASSSHREDIQREDIQFVHPRVSQSANISSYSWVALVASVILPLIASFGFLICGIYNFCLGQIAYIYRNVFMIYRIVYWLALVLAALIGYVACRKFPSTATKPTGFEYFVIISCVGPILQSVFTIVANVATNGFVVPMGMFLTEEITNIVEIFAQVVFYAYAKSVQIRNDENNNDHDEQNQRTIRWKRSVLMSVLSSFAICNGFLWIEDSFIDTRSSATSWQKEYYKNWPLIYNMFNPLTLVFRFNSALLFLNVLLDKRQ